MSYFTFHLVFILPPIILLALLQRSIAGVKAWRVKAALPLIASIALIYTTPWDNYLVWRGIWHYGIDRIIGTIGYVPIEEYLFFLLQCLLTGLWLYWLLAHQPESMQPGLRVERGWLMLIAGVILSFAGVWMLQKDSTLYCGLILTWATPVLALQWFIGTATLWTMRRVWLLGVLVPTVYLWITDLVAINSGIWQISQTYTIGLQFFGLPVEEATFFLVTNLLTVQGILLFLRMKVNLRADSDSKTAFVDFDQARVDMKS